MTSSPSTQRAVRLNQANLADISGVPTPDYDRSSITCGIVHLGVGGFHRSHQAMYIDRLLRAGGAQDWGICGVGVLDADARMAEVMTAQDCLYTLVVKHPDGTLEPRVIGSIVDYLHAPSDPDAVIERMAGPDCRLVTLTITEGGYHVDPATGRFDADDPAVRADADAGGTAPRTAFGLIVEALRRRRERGVEPFTVLSCDNIEGNGTVARTAVTGFAALRDADLGTWISEQVQFPSCMVDRITPVTTDDDRALVEDELGIVDGWPVVCEPFTQWVVEDEFGLGRPELDEVGVQLVADVRPYELMKLRLLNASHQGLCYFAYLAGERLVHEAMANQSLTTVLRDYMREEATPTLEPVPGIDLPAYQDQLIERFSNAYVRDTVARLCAESSDRIPKWLLPVVWRQLELGGPVHRSAAVVASWARYAEGVDEHGQPITVVDQLADHLVPIARRQREDRTAFLANRAVFGDLVDQPRFVEAYLRTLDSLYDKGAAATVDELARG